MGLFCPTWRLLNRLIIHYDYANIDNLDDLDDDGVDDNDLDDDGDLDDAQLHEWLFCPIWNTLMMILMVMTIIMILMVMMLMMLLLSCMKEDCQH